MRRKTATIANFIVGRNMPTKAKTTVRKTPARLDKSREDGHLGGGKIRRIHRFTRSCAVASELPRC